jgi:hypothetical protein
LEGPDIRVESAWFQCLRLKYDDLLSNFAFNVNLLRHHKMMLFNCAPGRATPLTPMAPMAASAAAMDRLLPIHYIKIVLGGDRCARATGGVDDVRPGGDRCAVLWLVRHTLCIVAE